VKTDVDAPIAGLFGIVVIAVAFSVTMVFGGVFIYLGYGLPLLGSDGEAIVSEWAQVIVRTTALLVASLVACVVIMYTGDYSLYAFDRVSAFVESARGDDS